MNDVQYCPHCGSIKIAQLYPEKGDGRHTATWKCEGCDVMWHHSVAGIPDGGLREKYTVLKDGKPVGTPCLVMLFSDPAGLASISLYAELTRNKKLSRDLRSLVAEVEKNPDAYPPGSEGSLNAGIKSRIFRGQGFALVLVEKDE